VALELAKADPCRASAAQIKQLTPELAVLYASKTPKTLTRDLNELVEMGLLCRVGHEYEANGSILTQLLPGRRSDTALPPS
jgi:hypothetical protein